MKKGISEILKNAKGLKDQAAKIGKDAAKTAGHVKGAVQIGVATSKVALEKASKMVNRETLSQGMDVASKGMEVAAKGAKAVSNTLEQASDSMKKARDKFKKST